jgi:hypothetical protein
MTAFLLVYVAIALLQCVFLWYITSKRRIVDGGLMIMITLFSLFWLPVFVFGVGYSMYITWRVYGKNQ